MKSISSQFCVSMLLPSQSSKIPNPFVQFLVRFIVPVKPLLQPVKLKQLPQELHADQQPSSVKQVSIIIDYTTVYMTNH